MTEENLPEEVLIYDGPTSILDGGDSFGLLNYLSGKLLEIVSAINPDLLMQTEGDIRKRAMLTSADYALRVSFWREFERVVYNKTGKISPKMIYAGIVSEQYFYQKFLKDEDKVAFMVRPMQSYDNQMNVILHRATERLWELLEIPIYNSKGRFDSKAAEVLLKAVTQIENRVKGMAVQKLDKRTVNMNVSTNSKAIQGIETMSALNARLKALEQEVKGEGSRTDSIEAGSDVHQVIPVTITEEEREVIEADVVRSEGASGGE